MRFMFRSCVLTLIVGCGASRPVPRADTLQHESLREVREVDRCEGLADREFWSEAARGNDGWRASQLAIASDEPPRATPIALAGAGSARVGRTAPVLGSTAVESQALCMQRGGRQTGQHADDGGDDYQCAIDGVPSYRAHVPAGQTTFDAVKKFYAAADVASMRRAIEGNIGGADSEIIERGCQVWTWKRKAVRVHLAMFAGRVAVTLRTTSMQDAPGEEALIMELQY
jgi:hypothetical protein